MDNHQQSARWISRIASGDEEAFSCFYDCYAPLVFRIARNILKDDQEAEDVCQDIFMDIMQRPEQYDPARGSVDAWLAVKTKNKTLDVLRRKKRIVCQPDQASWETAKRPASFNPTFDQVVYLSQQNAVYEALAHIPASQRQAVYAMYFEQHTHREISEKLDRPLGTVKSLIRYGLKNMKKHLNPGQNPFSGGDPE